VGAGSSGADEIAGADGSGAGISCAGGIVGAVILSLSTDTSLHYHLPTFGVSNKKQRASL
jgi:hypothetical protein